MKYLRQFLILMSVMALTSMSFPSPLFGQSFGERVRVTLEGDKMIGTIASMNQSGFDLNLSEGGSLSVMYSDIKRLERSLGTENYSNKERLTGGLAGGLAGVLVGGLVGGLVGLELYLDGLESYCCERSGEIIIEGASKGAIFLGAPLGLYVMVRGALMKKEKWETIPTPSMSGRLRISPMIDVASIGGNRRAVIGARIRF